MTARPRSSFLGTMKNRTLLRGQLKGLLEQQRRRLHGVVGAPRMLVRDASDRQRWPWRQSHAHRAGGFSVSASVLHRERMHSR